MKTLRDKEDMAAKALEAAGLIMISRPGDGIEESGLKWHWGVCVGSHGGYGKTLVGAMRRCLKCCDIGKFWKVAPPDNNMRLETLFKRVSRKYLDRELY